MNKIFFSQRIDYFESRSEIREGIDVKFVELILDFGYFPIGISHTIIKRNKNCKILKTIIDELNPSAIILTGGQNIGEFAERDFFEFKLIEIAIEHKIPLIGICRGAQVVNAYFGGTLVKIENHVKAKHKISGKMESEVVCFHNNGIKILGKNLIETFQSSDKNIEGFEHEIYPITGLMWHPERNTPLSSSMLKYLSERLVNKH